MVRVLNVIGSSVGWGFIAYFIALNFFGEWPALFAGVIGMTIGVMLVDYETDIEAY